MLTIIKKSQYHDGVSRGHLFFTHTQINIYSFRYILKEREKREQKRDTLKLYV